MSAIGELDESNATLRVIMMLSTVNEIMLSDLYEAMRSKYGVGRRKVETALGTCIKLNLVKRETKRLGNNPMPSLFHSLTVKGKKIAAILFQLEKALQTLEKS